MELSHDKIVNFTLCNYCQYKDNPEYAEPCSDCLDNATNVDSRRPIHFKDTGELEKIFKNSAKGE